MTIYARMPSPCSECMFIHLYLCSPAVPAKILANLRRVKISVFLKVPYTFLSALQFSCLLQVVSQIILATSDHLEPGHLVLWVPHCWQKGTPEVQYSWVMCFKLFLLFQVVSEGFTVLGWKDKQAQMDAFKCSPNCLSTVVYVSGLKTNCISLNLTTISAYCKPVEGKSICRPYSSDSYEAWHIWDLPHFVVCYCSLDIANDRSFWATLLPVSSRFLFFMWVR